MGLQFVESSWEVVIFFLSMNKIFLSMGVCQLWVKSPYRVNMSLNSQLIYREGRPEKREGGLGPNMWRG